MQLPIVVELRRSFLSEGFLIGCHGLAAVSVLFPPWPVWGKGLLLAGLAISAWFSWHHGLSKATGLRLHGDGSLECRLSGSRDFVEAAILPNTIVHPWLVAARLDLGRRRMVVVVFPDSANSEDFRRLRLWLRWRPGISVRRGGA